MAVDTAAKRKSMLKFSGGSAAALVFLQGGGIPASDRATLLFLYEGIALDSPVAVSATALSIASTAAQSVVRKIAFKIPNTERSFP